MDFVGIFACLIGLFLFYFWISSWSREGHQIPGNNSWNSGILFCVYVLKKPANICSSWSICQFVSSEILRLCWLNKTSASVFGTDQSLNFLFRDYNNCLILSFIYALNKETYSKRRWKSWSLNCWNLVLGNNNAKWCRFVTSCTKSLIMWTRTKGPKWRWSCDLSCLAWEFLCAFFFFWFSLYVHEYLNFCSCLFWSFLFIALSNILYSLMRFECWWFHLRHELFCLSLFSSFLIWRLS